MIPLSNEDETLLCGRANEVRQLLDNCIAGRVTVVSAQPCIGVTSFLEAGARPALEREECIVISLRDWSGRSFATTLREKVAAAVGSRLGYDFGVEDEDLETTIHRGCRKTGCRIVLILDQFEDYLGLTSADVTEPFDSELARVAQLQGAAPMLFGVHDDALEALGRFRQLIPNFLGGHIELKPLTADNARLWMKKEADRRHMTLEPAAADALVAASSASLGSDSSGKRIHPFLFAAGVERLIDAEIRMRSGAVRLATIAEYGGVDRLILESLDSSLAELSTTHSEIFFRWCNILIGPEGRRQSATERALTEYAGKLNRFVLTLLPILLSKNLLRTVRVGNESRYEIARDGMVPMIRHWWEQRETVIVARRRAAFRIRSISVAVGTIVLAYAAWLYLSIPK